MKFYLFLVMVVSKNVAPNPNGATSNLRRRKVFDTDPDLPYLWKRVLGPKPNGTGGWEVTVVE